MIDLHYWTTPNGHKITMFLEETGLPYRLVPVDITKNAQFDDEFLKISPNNKIPAIVDQTPLGGSEPVSIFESGAILIYLAYTWAALHSFFGLSIEDYPAVERWLEAVASRPATERAYTLAKQLNPQAPMPVRRAERIASQRKA